MTTIQATDQDWLKLLDRAVRAYPASAQRRRRSRVIQHAGEVELAFSFNQSLHDQVDALVVAFMAERLKARACEPSDGRPATACYLCDESQAKLFGRHLAYASTMPMADPPPLTTHRTTPFSTLLTQTLLAFVAEYEDKPNSKGLPSLEVCSNMLRVVPKSGISFADLEKAAVLSKRVVQVVVRHCVDLGWLTLDTLPGRRTPSIIKKTDEGHSMLLRGARRQKLIERKWSERFEATYSKLRNSLTTIVHTFDLEYPHFISGYGVADEALTGGNYLPAEEGPPRIPARGTEWPVVLRRSHKTTNSLPLTTLLCHTLTQFALDYEADQLGRLGLTALFFQHLPDEGMSLGEARKLTPITGNGKSLHELHMNVVLEPGKPSDVTRMVWPTQKTRRARDAYPFQVADLEKRWRKKFGATTMSDLRRALETILKSVQTDSMPDYPNTTVWTMPWVHPFLISAKF